MPSNNAVTPNVSSAFGTGDGTVADVGGGFNQATLNNNFRDVVNAINASRLVRVDVSDAGEPFAVFSVTVDAGAGNGKLGAGTYELRIPINHLVKVS